MNTPAPAQAPSPSQLTDLKIDRTQTPPRSRWSRWRWPGLLAALLLLGVLWYTVPRGDSVQTVSVVSSTPSQQHVVLTASGYVVAQRRASVASKATGRLVALYVREGSRVKQGEVMARLDPSDVMAAMAAAQAGVRQAEVGVRQAQVELTNAQAELKRSQGLQAQGFISPQAVDAAQTRVRAAMASVQAAQAGVVSAQAQVKVQQVNEDFTEIRAPFDGVVLVKNANEGDIITPFSNAAGSQGAVVTMADMSTLEVEADVSEGSLSQVRVGQPVEIMLDALPGVRFMGQVGGIVPTVDRAKATVMTKVRFQKLDDRVLPEMSAKVSFLSRPITQADQQPVLAVNPQALQLRDGVQVVWRLQPGPEGQAEHTTAEPVAVKVGRKLGEVTEVTPLQAGALKTGQKVVLNPSARLKPGNPVVQAQP